MRRPQKQTQHFSPPRKAFLSGVKTVILVIVACLLALSLPMPTRAQGEASLLITDLDTREFPLIRATVKAVNLDGSLQTGLNAQSFTVVEDGQNIAPRDLQKIYQGLHLALAVNPSVGLDFRDPQGVSHFSKLREAFRRVTTVLMPGSGDRYSLFINPDVRYADLSELDSFIIALDAYQQNFRNQATSFESLTLALDALSADDSMRDKVLLYITAMPLISDLAEMDPLVQQARSHNIRVYIWAAGTVDLLDFPQGRALQEFAQATGGSLFSFNGNEVIPDPADYLRGLGYQYQLSYFSQARESGTHELEIALEATTLGTLRSAAQDFSIEVAAVSPEFINPPAEITVQVDRNGVLTPDKLPIEVNFTYPDGHPRGLTRSTLWLNGNVYQQNEAAPFGSYSIDLGAFDESQELSFRVTALDELGLSGSSGLHKINLQISDARSAGSSAWLQSGWFIGAIILLLLAGAGVFLFRRGKVSKTRLEAVETAEEITATLPVIKALATLISLDKDDLPAPMKPILIVADKTLIGRDSAQCQVVINDPALEPVHAQLLRNEDGTFTITDLHTSAGTWVNFVPLGSEPTRIQHGDILHLGSRDYRFNSSARTSEDRNKPKPAVPAL